jgi:hypothetical protein
MATEALEFQYVDSQFDIDKKNALFYGTSSDVTNLKERILTTCKEHNKDFQIDKFLSAE